MLLPRMINKVFYEQWLVLPVWPLPRPLNMPFICGNSMPDSRPVSQTRHQSIYPALAAYSLRESHVCPASGTFGRDLVTTRGGTPSSARPRQSFGREDCDRRTDSIEKKNEIHNSTGTALRVGSIFNLLFAALGCKIKILSA